MIPQGYQFKSPLILESIEKGRAEGFAEGFAEGRAEGFAKGFAEGWALSVLDVFEAREMTVTEEARSRILACTDHEQLSLWLLRAVTVSSVDELFTH